jgi:hypothetical protein
LARYSKFLSDLLAPDIQPIAAVMAPMQPLMMTVEAPANAGSERRHDPFIRPDDSGFPRYG